MPIPVDVLEHLDLGHLALLGTLLVVGHGQLHGVDMCQGVLRVPISALISSPLLADRASELDDFSPVF